MLNQDADPESSTEAPSTTAPETTTGKSGQGVITPNFCLSLAALVPVLILNKIGNH